MNKPLEKIIYVVNPELLIAYFKRLGFIEIPVDLGCDMVAQFKDLTEDNKFEYFAIYENYLEIYDGTSIASECFEWTDLGIISGKLHLIKEIF